MRCYAGYWFRVRLVGMNKQLSFSASEYAGKKKATIRERFLGEMEEVVPWGKLIALIEPCYPKGERGRPPVGIERMLRIYFLSQWYGLADEALEDAIYDSQAMRNFIGVDLGGESVPDATTLLKFRHLLEENELTRAIFEEIGRHLKAKQLMMKEGTIVWSAPDFRTRSYERFGWVVGV
jgi:transposase, IS5 family